MACPQLGVILAYWKQTGVSSPKNPIALAVGVSIVTFYYLIIKKRKKEVA